MVFGSGSFRYELVDDWARIPQGWSFKDIGGLVIDSQDRVHVLNRSEHPIMTFSSDGALLGSWGEGFFDHAHGACLGPNDSIYCTDDIRNVVARFSVDGRLLMTLGGNNKGSDTGYVRTFCFWQSLATIVRGAPPFNRPTGVCVASNGDILVADGYGNARVHRFSSSGDLLSSWGEPGGGNGQFRLPHSVRTDRRGNVWVADRENHRIQIFDSSGAFLDRWCDLVRPTDLFIDNDDGVVYVTELCERVSVFTTEGRLLTRWGNADTSMDEALFLHPHAIAVDSRGSVYVGDVPMAGWQVDRGPRCLHKFARVV